MTITLNSATSLQRRTHAASLLDGEIVEDEKPDSLFNNPRDPRTKALIDRYRTGTG